MTSSRPFSSVIHSAPSLAQMVLPSLSRSFRVWPRLRRRAALASSSLMAFPSAHAGDELAQARLGREALAGAGQQREESVADRLAARPACPGDHHAQDLG